MNLEKIVLIMHIFRPNIYKIIGPLKIFAHHLDLFKDSLLVAELVSIVGGIGAIEKNYTEFRSAVSFINIIFRQDFIDCAFCEI